VESLVKAMLQGGNPLTVGVGIVIEVIRKNNSDYDPEHLNSPDLMPSMYDPIYLGTLLRVFAKHIPDFMALIKSSKHTITEGGKMKTVERGQLNSAWGAKIEPLGFDRFKTCELMAELLHCSNMGLLNEPGSDEYVLQRDAERERIVREGAFGQCNDGNSTFDGNDSTVDFVNGSIGGFASPEDSRDYEGVNAGDEGFEDVTTVLVDKEKETGNKESESASTSTAAASKQPQEKAAQAESKEPEQPRLTESSTPPSEPLSATDELAAQISAVSLNSTPSNDENQKPSESKPGESATKQELVPASAPMSSNPDAIPAPLFASKEQHNEAAPDQATKVAEPTENVPETHSAQDTTGDAQQPLHPDIQLDINGQPVVGDYLKIMFVENRVVPTILVSRIPRASSRSC
jgi:SIT4-associating protein SAP185/190